MAKYNQEMNKAEANTKDLGKSSDNLAGTLKGLFTLALVERVAGYAVEMVNLGTEAQATEERFRELTSTMGSYDEVMAGLRDATLGIVDDMHLQAGAMLLVQTAGIETSDELERMMNLITLTKKPSEDMTTAIQNFGLMLANNSILRLDSFGISASKVRARIIELQQTMGLDRSEAFRMAVLEEGEKNIEKFGAAADVASTAISRLGVSAQNAIQDLAQLAAQGAQGFALGIEFILGMTPQQQAHAKQMADEAAISVALDLQEAFDAAMANGAFGEDPQFIGTFIQNALDMAARDPSIMNNMDNFLDQLFGRMGSRPSGELTQVYRDILDQTLQIQAANQADRDIAIEIADGQQQIADAEAERLAASEAVADTQREINHLGQGAAEIFTNIGEAIMNMGMDAAAEQAAKLREELDGMSLSELFGETSGGRLGEITDMITGAMEELGKSSEAIVKFQDNMDLLSGRNTASSQLVETVIAPTIASIADINPAQAQLMASSLNDIMNEAFLQGINVNSPAFIDALSQQFNAADFQLIDPQQFIESLDPSAEIAGNFVTMAEDGSIIRDSVAFWGEQAPTIAEHTQATERAMGNIKTAMDDISSKTYALKLKPEMVDIPAFMASILAPLVQLVQSAGGVMPGTNQQASQSGTMVHAGQGF